jgi:hypothetical protein
MRSHILSKVASSDDLSAHLEKNSDHLCIHAEKTVSNDLRVDIIVNEMHVHRMFIKVYTATAIVVVPTILVENAIVHDIYTNGFYDCIYDILDVTKIYRRRIDYYVPRMVEKMSYATLVLGKTVYMPVRHAGPLKVYHSLKSVLRAVKLVGFQTTKYSIFNEMYRPDKDNHIMSATDQIWLSNSETCDYYSIYNTCFICAGSLTGSVYKTICDHYYHLDCISDARNCPICMSPNTLNLVVIEMDKASIFSFTTA